MNVQQKFLSYPEASDFSEHIPDSRCAETIFIREINKSLNRKCMTPWLLVKR